MRQAALHITMGYPRKALEELECLQKLAPGQPRAYFLLGQAHGMLGPRDRSEALKNYTIALSLEPWVSSFRQEVFSKAGSADYL
jgi:predicted Zn-dependent protease